MIQLSAKSQGSFVDASLTKAMNTRSGYLRRPQRRAVASSSPLVSQLRELVVSLMVSLMKC